jgi:hypothetical protein
MKILFLDDDQARRARFLSEWPCAHIASTVGVANHLLDKAAAEQSPYDVVCLDHDLGGTGDVEPCSAACGCAVVDTILHHGVAAQARIIVIHSYNETAAAGMADRLAGAGARVVMAPFNSGLFWRLLTPPRHAIGVSTPPTPAEIADSLPSALLASPNAVSPVTTDNP